MNSEIIKRYRILDGLFRMRTGSMTIEELAEHCSSKLSLQKGEYVNVSRRTIEQDLYNIQYKYGGEFVPNLRYGKKKLYQYEDPDFNLMKVITQDKNFEKEILQEAIESLRCYEEIPQYRWLITLLEERLAGNSGNMTAVSFQSNPELQGLVYFSDLMDAILKKYVIRFQYHPYGKNPIEEVVSPYQLKQFNDRWFLICRAEGFDGLLNLALDRIEGDILRTDNAYVDCLVDLEDYYKRVIGVTVRPEEQAQHIYLRVSKKRYPYIATKPIHSSQMEIHSREDETSKVIHIYVQVNNELEAKILSYGNDMEVLEPQELREKVTERIRDLAKKYNI